VSKISDGPCIVSIVNHWVNACSHKLKQSNPGLAPSENTIQLSLAGPGVYFTCWYLEFLPFFRLVSLTVSVKWTDFVIDWWWQIYLNKIDYSRVALRVCEPLKRGGRLGGCVLLINRVRHPKRIPTTLQWLCRPLCLRLILYAWFLPYHCVVLECS